MKILYTYLFVLMSWSALAQYSSNNELTFGGIIHTRSGFLGGVSSKYAKPINKEWAQFYSLEIVNVRHPKELRIPTQYSGTFILGKSNYLFNIRPQFGLEKAIFKKDPSEGVRVSIIGAAGPTLAVVKPYLVEYLVDNETSVKEQFNKDIVLSSIVGGAGWYTGFGQSKFVPGGNVKLSMAFEYSTFKKRISTIETGFIYEQLASKVELNPFVSSESSFFIAFIALNFGKKL